MSDPITSKNQLPTIRDIELKSFPVVGLGASAGGLKALIQFFELMPASSGMAFVVILHLSPKHESHSADLLQNVTKMPVMQVNEAVRIEPNRVYVIPPTQHLQMTDGVITLKDLPLDRTQQVAIDLFFRTLADAHRDRAVCVVLSGTGSDGAVGLTRVKEEGGIAIAQSPDDAEYDGMPRNAIGTGVVDFVLPVAEMPNKLIQLWQNASVIKLPPAEEQIRLVDQTQAAEEALRQILLMLRARMGHDFLHYKRATVLRRIERRMQVNQLPDLPAYLNFLREHQEETPGLLRDMLISVTNFFRDREAFEALEREIIPRLFTGKTPADQVRVWVAGCATGEEAYSIAMLLIEHAAGMANPPRIQVFATDIDEQMIARAREGLYPESIVTDLIPARLRNFFEKESGGYLVKKSVRERVLFAAHNVLKDLPFSRLDLVSCRNLMIYLTREVQEQILALFHFALHPGGYLFLGSSESADSVPNLFAALDKRHRLFKGNVVARSGLQVPTLPLGTPARKIILPSDGPRGEQRRVTFGELHQRLLEQYAPPSVIITHEYNIVHLSDRAGRFLQFAGGEPSHNLLKVIHPELRLDLRTALFQALQTKRSVEARRVRLKREGHTYYVNMIARPVLSDDAQQDYVLVIFDEVEEILGDEGKEPQRDGQSESLVAQLENELQRTKEQLQATIEQYETASEEMRASNEELQAVNEELRSATEELETSKEELQSINEELMTVNFELKGKVDEVSHVNDDLKNLISATEIATIFVDRGLKIRRFTPRALDLFNLIPTDIGRSLYDITHRLAYPELAADVEQVLAKLSSIERELMAQDGRRYVARLLPYRTLDDRIDGAVLNFVEITARRQAEQRAHLTEARMRLLVESAKDYAIFTTDLERRVTSWSPGAQAIFGYSESEMLGQSADLLFTPEDRQAGVPAHEAETALAMGRAENERYHSRKNDEARFYGSGVVMTLRDDDGTVVGFVKIIRDLSEQKRTADLLRVSEQRLQRMVNVHHVGVLTFDYEGKLLHANDAFLEMVGYTRAEFAAQDLTWRDFTPPEYVEESERIIEQLRQTGRGGPYEKEYCRKDGSRIWLMFVGADLGDGTNIEYVLDLTESKQAAAVLRESEERLRALVENLPGGAVFIVDQDLRYVVAEGEALSSAGFAPQDLIGRTVAEAMPPELAADYETKFRVALNGEPFEYEHEAHGRSFISRGVPLANANGEIYAVLAISYDITARKQMEEQLRSKEEHLRLLIESVKDYAIITFDTTHRITAWNVGAQLLFGYTEAEMLGQTGAILFTPEDRERGAPEQEFGQAQQTGRAADERWHLHKDGSRFYVSGVMSAIRDGALSGFVKIARDLTARKQTEEDLHERRKDLETAVQARTIELSRANELLQTEVGERRGAEERVKDLLRTVISAQEDERQRISRELHDHLGQLLTALRLNLESLRRRNDETRSQLGEGIAQAQTVAAQLDEGVDFLAWELRPTALNDLGLKAALANYVAEWKKHFKIPAEFHGGVSGWLRLAPEVEINFYRIAQEALNNIAKHAQANQVNVLLERRNQHLVLIVEDDGVGFDINEETDAERGLGLVGMSERAALVGGTLEIESTPGSGTTVFARVLLPSNES